MHLLTKCMMTLILKVTIDKTEHTLETRTELRDGDFFFLEISSAMKFPKTSVIYYLLFRISLTWKRLQC